MFLIVDIWFYDIDTALFYYDPLIIKPLFVC